MAIYVGDSNRVIYKFESGTYGTAFSSGHWIGLVTNHDFTSEENVTSIRYTGTSSRNVGQQINTSKDYDGTISFHPQNARMFGFALGSTADTSGTISSHTIRELNSDATYAYTSGTNSNHNFPSFTIIDSKKGQVDGGHFVRTVKGCVANTLSFNAPQGEPVSCELGYVAQSVTLGSKTTQIGSATEDTSRPFIWSDVEFHLPSGTKMNELTDLSWSINNNLERRHYDNGSKVVDNITPLNREYEITLTLDGNSIWGKTLDEQYWQGGSSFNCMIKSVMTAGSEELYFVMSGCKVTSFSAPSPSEGINEFSVTITPENTIITGSDTITKHNPW